MRGLLCGIALAAAALLPSIAPAGAAEPLRLTVEQALDLLAGLTALDGHEELVGEGKQQQKIVVPYTLGGPLRQAIFHDITATKPVAADFQNARNAVVIELSKGAGKLDPGSPESAKLALQTQAMMAQPVDLKLDRIKLADLKLDSNPIPGTVLAQLAPILDEPDGKTP